MKIFLIAFVSFLLLAGSPLVVEAAKESFDRSKPHVNVGVIGNSNYDFSDVTAVSFASGITQFGNLTLKRGLVKSSNRQLDADDFILWQRNFGGPLDICVEIRFGPPENAKVAHGGSVMYRLLKNCTPEMEGEEVDELTGEAYQFVTAKCEGISAQERGCF